MFNDKTVVITGASRGIGKELALKFASLNAKVVINYMNNEPTELLKEFEDKGYKGIAVKADVSNFDQAKELIDKSKEHFGSIDVLINNAGITKDGLLMRMTEDDFDKVIDINLKGAFNTIRHASNIMLKQRQGCIINMSSVVGLVGNVGQANYAASKAGLIGLTRSVAREMAMRGVRCNAVAPGYIETDMTDKLSDSIKSEVLKTIPLKRFGTVKDVADTCVFLASNNYITGQVINVDGGMVSN